MPPMRVLILFSIFTPFAAFGQALPFTVQKIPPIQIATTGTAVCFAAQTLSQGCSITAQSTSGAGNATTIKPNVAAIWVGNSSVAIGVGNPLPPGTSQTIAVSNSSGLCINGTAGDGATATCN